MEKLDVDVDGEIDFGLSFYFLNVFLFVDIYMYIFMGKFGLIDFNFFVKLKFCN